MDRALDKEQLSLLLKSYHRLRDTGKRLNSKLIKYLPGEVINSVARTLGLMKDGILILGNMDQSSILMDQCLYTYRVNGKTVFETYLENNPVPPHSEECMLLNAWKSARYALLSIEKIEP